MQQVLKLESVMACGFIRHVIEKWYIGYAGCVGA